MLKKLRFLVIPLCLIIGSCQTQVQETDCSLSEEDKEIIKNTVQTFHEDLNTLNLDTAFSKYTEDAVIKIQDVKVLEGLSEIKKLNWVGTLEWDSQIIDVSGNGDLAYVWESYTLLLDIEGYERQKGESVFILRKQEDNSWLISKWIGSRNPQ
jgi:ketosteroid isomerase-like protein